MAGNENDTTGDLLVSQQLGAGDAGLRLAVFCASGGPARLTQLVRAIEYDACTRTTNCSVWNSLLGNPFRFGTQPCFVLAGALLSGREGVDVNFGHCRRVGQHTAFACCDARG